LAGPHAVDVELVQGRHPRVKRVVDRLDAHDANVAREVRVDRAGPDVGRERLRDVDVRDLPERVDAGGGAPRAWRGAALPLDALDRRFDRALNRRMRSLRLPAAIVGAVVVDGELETHRRE